MPFRACLPTILTMIFVALHLSARADTFTYTYTGNNFTTFTHGYNPVTGASDPAIFNTRDAVTGYFTTPTALAPNQTSAVSVLSAGFSDGYSTLSPNGTGRYFFVVATDSLGNIDAWNIELLIEPAFLEIQTKSGLGQIAEDYGFVDGNLTGEEGANQGFNTNDPGTWTESVNGVPVSNSPAPEPSSFILLAIGCLGLAAVTRRNFSRAVSIHAR